MPTVSLVSSASLMGADGRNASGALKGIDAIVIGTVAAPDGLVLAPGAEWLAKALGADLLVALKAAEASGRVDEVVKIPTLGRLPVPLIVATGLGQGDPTRLEAEAVRQGVGAAFRTLNSTARGLVCLGGDDVALIEAIADGIALGGYRFTRYKSAAKPVALKRVSVAVPDPSAAPARAALRRSKVISEAVNNTRDLVNTPPNALNPVTFADYAKQVGEAAGLTVEVLDERALKRARFGAILAVGGGSATPPRLVRLSYRPARASRHVALVGKGITFDTGGLDLKRAMMAEMKSDMGGAAAVIEAVIAAAKLRLPISVTATVPMAENAVSAGSYRPSDVLTLRDGRTVEVDNTDAEGRLILADAILRACEDDPDYLIETSTLTGAQIVALGTRTMGAMGSDGFRELVVAAGTAAGESLWGMPLPPQLRAGLDSPVADLQNLPKDRGGPGMLVAGVFLSDFVAEGVEWVHLDIAGPSFVSAASGYTPRGGTGVIVRTIVATLAELAR